MVGQTVLHYRILEKIGQGSTGDVYLAEDALNNRQVALKVLPDFIRKNPDRLRQLRTEAEAAMELNHPNIVRVFSVEEAEVEGEGRDVFVVMEYVRGKPLSVLMAWKALTLDQFFNAFIPLSDALCYAHELGVTHRDLNPDNVIVTREGIPKILDFGMASITRPETRVTDSATSTRMVDVLRNMSRSGVVIDAPAYMSPEQVEGESTDKRTDIFSFGVMMYEAITGRRPFQGKNHMALVTNIVKQDPTPVTTLKPDVPFLLGRMISNCLRKDRRRRYQSMLEVRRELEDARLDVVGGRVLMEIPETIRRPERPVYIPEWQQPRVLAGAGAALFIMGVLLTWLMISLGTDGPVPRLKKYQIPLDVNPVAVDEAARPESSDPVISPDGTRIVYSYQGLLWMRDLAALKPRALAGTDGARMAFWSPNSDTVAYFVVSDIPGRSGLRKVPVEGGASALTCPLPDGMKPRGGTWHEKGGIVIGLGRDTALDGVLFKVYAGAESLQVYQTADPQQGEIGVIYPQFLPDGETLLFTVTRTDRSGSLIAQNGEYWKTLLSQPGELLVYPVYASTGHLIYQRGLTSIRELWAVPFDASDLETTGESFMVSGHGANPSVSNDGVLVYHAAPTHGSDQLVWVDRQGRIIASIGQPQERISNPVLSPDGRRVAVTGWEQGNFDIWVHDVERQIKTRLTNDPAYDFLPVWSPGGDRIAYNSVRGASADIYIQRVDDSGDVQKLDAGKRSAWISDWSRNGKYLMFDAEDPETRRDLWYIPLDGKAPARPFLKTAHQEFYPALSPDNRFVAYQSNESGRFEIYLRSFPDAEDKWTVSAGGGLAPRWRRDGGELYFVQNNVLMAVPVKTSPYVQLGWPQQLFDATEAGVRLLGEYQEAAYDITPDGLRFVVVQERQESPTITLVENWAEEFRRRH